MSGQERWEGLSWIRIVSSHGNMASGPAILMARDLAFAVSDSPETFLNLYSLPLSAPPCSKEAPK